MTMSEYKKEKMKDPEFAKEYEAIQPELSVIRAMIDARTSQNLTQKQLAEKNRYRANRNQQAGERNTEPEYQITPEILAEGMGMVLDVRFRPKDAT